MSDDALKRLLDELDKDYYHPSFGIDDIRITLREAFAAGVAAGRRQAAEEIAVAIEAVKPSVRRFWDTADAARVYALNDAAKIARRLAAPAEPVEEDTDG